MLNRWCLIVAILLCVSGVICAIYARRFHFANSQHTGANQFPQAASAQNPAAFSQNAVSEIDPSKIKLQYAIGQGSFCSTHFGSYTVGTLAKSVKCMKLII